MIWEMREFFSCTLINLTQSFCSNILTVIGRKVNMAARLMVNYPEILSCDDDTYRSGKSKLKEENFVTLPFVKLKGIAEPGTVREYSKHHEWVISKLTKAGHFTVFCSDTWPMNVSEARDDPAFIQASLLFSFKCDLVNSRTTWFTQQKKQGHPWSRCHSKVRSIVKQWSQWIHLIIICLCLQPRSWKRRVRISHSRLVFSQWRMYDVVFPKLINNSSQPWRRFGYPAFFWFFVLLGDTRDTGHPVLISIDFDDFTLLFTP